MTFDIVVVGGGIAGLTAAAYVAKSGRSVALFEKQAKTGGLGLHQSHDTCCKSNAEGKQCGKYHFAFCFSGWSVDL